MILSHFSDVPFVFDASWDYTYENEHDKISHYTRGKPKGLWLSDENDLGWKQWCEGENFGLDRLKHKTDFSILDSNRLLHLKDELEIRVFFHEYKFTPYPEYLSLQYINWDLVREKYGGVLISPYVWNLRLHSDFMWYYGWDCASAVVWDLKILSEIPSERTGSLPVNLAHRSRITSQ